MKSVIPWSLAALLTLASALPAASHGRASLRRNVEIEVVSDSGSVLRSISYREFRMGMTQVIKQYLEAEKGKHYAIVVRNRTSDRIGVVIAVDGRNIISGGRSDLEYREAMYIVNAGQTARYDGWRTSQKEVHRFFFTENEEAYAARTFGDVSAMGLIAVAVYRERGGQELVPLKREQPPSPSADRPSRDRSSAKAQESAGTGFGDAKHSPVIEVTFEPERIPVQKVLVKYEWREVLCRKGILRCGASPANRLWDDARYAPYPPEY